ncbi:MAG: hypothetical protein ACP5C3_03290 [Methanomicrobiales archaeon]
MLTHEPLIKITHSKIRCYERKLKRKTKSGETHTYTVTQYVITLKHDQPFQCDEEVSIIKSEDYFRIDERLKKHKEAYNEFLEKLNSQEVEMKENRDKLKKYEILEVESKLKKLESMQREYEKLKDDYQRKVKELVKVKKELESKDQIIEELKSKGMMGRLMDRFKESKK